MTPAEAIPYPHVWAVANKTTVLLFKTEGDADRYICKFPGSIAGGLEKTLVPVMECH